MQFSQNLFESDALSAVCGNVARPGGFFLTSYAAGFCGLKPGDTVLDVGCGAGATMAFLAARFGVDACGVDPSGNMLERARRSNPQRRLYQGCAEALPLPDQAADAVISECSLSKMNDIDLALKEFFRVLKPSGWLVVSDMYIRRQCGQAGNPAQKSKGLMQKQEIFAHLEKSGFRQVIFEDHTDLLTQLTVDIIMKFGSIENFWGQSCGNERCAYSIPGVKLGYYLLIAQKTAWSGGETNG